MLILPKLQSLPEPSSSRQGWPWRIEENANVQFAIKNDLPKITIITPSYNQGQFLEETIRSVLLQGYPNLEYFVVDGGSTDNSVQIIQRYSPWLSWWVSERDNGQAHAINKGLVRATGEIIGYLNSDDLYKPGSLFAVMDCFLRYPDVDWMIGGCDVCRDGVDFMYDFRPKLPTARIDWIRAKVPGSFAAPQPSTFWRAKLFSEFGLFDELMYYFFDHEFMIRLGVAHRLPLICEHSLSIYRWHGDTKSAAGALNFVRERCRAAEKWKIHFNVQEQRLILEDCLAGLYDALMSQVLLSDSHFSGRLFSWLRHIRSDSGFLKRRATWATFARILGIWR